MKTIMNWVLSALILWLLSFLPFMHIGFDNWITLLIVALVIGLINALIVPIVKGLFKKKRANALLVIIISLIVNAAALWLAARIVPEFYIEFFPTAIIAAGFWL